MKTLIFFFVFFIFSFSLSAQNYKWVKGGGSTSSTGPGSTEWEQVDQICTDNVGNVYVAANVGDYNIQADTFFRHVPLTYRWVQAPITTFC